MAKQKKQLWHNADPRMDLIREEHMLLARQLWKRGKHRRGTAVRPAVTLASQALKVELREKNLAKWLNEESEIVLKFYKPLWWLNPVKWFKAHDMRKRRDLCTYMLTSPHMNRMLSKRSKPVTLLSTGWLLRPLLNLTKRFSRWSQRLKKREKFREDASDLRKKRKKDEKNRRAERLQKQDLQRQMRECDERTAKIRQEMAESEEKHRKALEASARERAAKKRAHKDRMKKEDQDFKVKLTELEKENILKMRKVEENSRKSWKKIMETDSIVSRRWRELQPTIARLNAMMAAVWICQISGKSTITRMATVIAEHDRIASRNGLRREGFDNYHYSLFRDTRRYDGVELEDRAAVAQEDDQLIRKANSSGPIRI